MSAQRVLPADVYDALELSALVYGGIGYGAWADDAGCPVCIHGHAASVLGLVPYDGSQYAENEISDLLYDIDISASESDRAVKSIGGDNDAVRVSFSAWCAKIGVTRGTP